MRIATRRVGMLVGGALLLSACGVCAQDWPQWRGPNRDNKVTGFTAPKTWPKELAQKWKVSVGVGEASPVLAGGKVYVFTRQGGDEVTLCLDAGSGKELWKDKYAGATVTRPASAYPGPRSTPAVGEGKVCTLGVGGEVSCLDAASGKLVWRHKTTPPRFNTSTSPLIVDGKCIVYGNALTAYDLATGESKWQWAGPGTPYGSPVLMTVEGVKQVVTPTTGAIAGVSLADGKLLWQVKIAVDPKDYQHNFSTPVVDGQTVIYSAAPRGGKGATTVALKIEKKGDGFTATELWKKDLAAHQYHTPLLKDGLLYGVSAAGRNFFCLDAKTGEQLWIDKSAQRGQCGSILDAGSVLLALTSDRQLLALKPSNKEYAELAKYQVADEETWCVPIISGNRIFVKDRKGSLMQWAIE